MTYPSPISPLVQRAYALARGRNQMLDTLHIWLASLSDSRAAGVAGSVLDACIDQNQRYGLQLLLSYELESQHWSSPQFDRSWPHENKTDRLKQCESSWQMYAARLGYGPTSAVILLTTLRDGDTMSKLTPMMRLCRIDRDEVDRQLQSRVNQLDPNVDLPLDLDGGRDAFISPGIPGQSHRTDPILPDLAPPWAPPAPRVESENGALQVTVVQLVRPLPASPRQMYYSAHPREMGVLLYALVRSGDSGELPVVAGKNGSPVGMIARGLADRLFVKQFLEQHAALRAYTGVETLDIRALAAYAEQPDLPAALSAVFRATANKRTILVLEHMERLQNNEALREAVRKALTMRGGALMFGVYHVANNADFNIDDIRLGLPAVAPLQISTYDEAETRNLLEHFYMPLWESKNFRFDSKAFDTVLKLESGAWVEYERKCLPYLAVDLGWDVIETITTGEEGVRQLALGALAALRAIKLREWDAASPELKKLLTDTEREITELSKQPRITHSKQPMIDVKRAHVSAQLLSSTRSEYHVPPHRPQGVGVPQQQPIAPDGRVV